MDEPQSAGHASGLIRVRALLADGDIDAGLSAIEAQGTVSAEEAVVLFEAGQPWLLAGTERKRAELSERLLKVAPDDARLLHLAGFYAQSDGDFGRAEEYYRRALAISPDYAFARLALAQLTLMKTGFRQGFAEYEARFDAVTEGSGADWRGLPIARWRGEPLTGKRLYLWAEQGLGDVAMFASLLAALSEMGARQIVLGMYPKLVSLFARSFPWMRVESLDRAGLHALGPTAAALYPQVQALAVGGALPFPVEPLKEAYEVIQRDGAFDYAAPMGDLLGYVPVEQARAVRGYLKPDAGRCAEIRSQFGAGRRIGISWATTNRREVHRNLPLEEWLPLLKQPGCQFVSLQHGVEKEMIERFNAQHGCRIQLAETVDLLQDAEGLFALIAAVDEVITIDNSNAHIAGALGVETLLLLPKGYNFRWAGAADGGCLWYDSVRIIAQQEAGQWDFVVRQAVETLFKSS